MEEYVCMWMAKATRIYEAGKLTSEREHRMVSGARGNEALANWKYIEPNAHPSSAVKTTAN